MLAGAKNVVEGEVRIGGQEHFYLEPCACVVTPGEDDEMTTVVSTQCPDKSQRLIASALGIPELDAKFGLTLRTDFCRLV